MYDLTPADLPIVFDALHADTELPVRATEGSAGYDLRAYLKVASVRCSDGTRQWDEPVAATDVGPVVYLEPGQMALVPLGFRARLPDGIEAQIRPRSGAAFKKGLHVANTPGTIDPDYPGEWLVPVRNASAGRLEISHGERIAQMVLARFEVADFERGEVGVSSSRRDGLGSTGHR